MARPSSFTQETADVICDRLLEGESLRSICSDEDMPHVGTVIRWLSAMDSEGEFKYPQFRVQYARAKEEQAEVYADEIIFIADTEQDSNKARVRIDSRKWIASKLKAKKYGDKLDLTSGGKELPAPIFGGVVTPKDTE